jgi:hypothetical protein
LGHQLASKTVAALLHPPSATRHCHDPKGSASPYGAGRGLQPLAMLEPIGYFSLDHLDQGSCLVISFALSLGYVNLNEVDGQVLKIMSCLDSQTSVYTRLCTA